MNKIIKQDEISILILIVNRHRYYNIMEINQIIHQLHNILGAIITNIIVSFVFLPVLVVLVFLISPSNWLNHLLVTYDIFGNSKEGR